MSGASAILESAVLRVPLVVFVALAVQTSLLADVRPFGAAGDIMVLLAVCAGLVAGPQRGAVAGFFIGLTFDLILATPFGLTALAYCLVGFAFGFLETGLAPGRTSWWLTMLTVAGGCAAGTVGYAVLATLFGVEGALTSQLVTVVLVVAVVGGLLAPVALPVMRWAMLGHRKGA